MIYYCIKSIKFKANRAQMSFYYLNLPISKVPFNHQH